MQFITDSDRLDALRGWAVRAIRQAPPGCREKRAGDRRLLQTKVLLVPLDVDSLRPLMARRIYVMSKDISETGLGLVSEVPLEADYYFAHVKGEPELALIRLVRNRCIRGTIHEYGAQIIDRYLTTEDIRARSPFGALHQDS